jgi:hypothetical protein
VILAFSNGCSEGQSCWRPIPVPDEFPFVPVVVALVWAVLFVLCLVVFLRRLGRS